MCVEEGSGHKDGSIYLKAEWRSGGGRGTGATGSFQEELESSS